MRKVDHSFFLHFKGCYYTPCKDMHKTSEVDIEFLAPKLLFKDKTLPMDHRCYVPTQRGWGQSEK